MKKKLLAVLLCALLVFMCSTVVMAESDTYTVDEAQNFIDGIVGFQQRQTGAESIQQWIDGALTEGAGVGSEWYVLALAQSGEYDLSAYESALLDYVTGNEIHLATTKQKYALCLAASGSTSGYISYAMDSSIGEQGIMSYVYGLHLLNNGYVSDGFTAEDVVHTLLDLQADDGGWSLTGASGDVDITAMTLQALAPHYASDAEVRAAANTALAFLSACQLADGDFASYGKANPESTAQVIVALSSLGIDCKTDSRFIKGGNDLFDGLSKYRLADGSFTRAQGGETNALATVQAFYASVAYVRAVDGRGSFYILDHADPENVQPAPTVGETTDTDALANTEIGSETGLSQVTDADGSGEPQKKVSYKLWVSLIIVGVGGGVCLALMLLKKRNIKNFIVVLVAVAVGVAFVCFTDLQSAEDYYDSSEITKENAVGTVTLTIRCDTVAGREEHIPSDGIILGTTEFAIEDGDTVYSILTEAARRHGIRVENNGSSEVGYISGINYLYELDFGDLSGWVYHVNGEAPSVSCGEYGLSDGDRIEWLYSCDLGEDVKQ